MLQADQASSVEEAACTLCVSVAAALGAASALVQCPGCNAVQSCRSLLITYKSQCSLAQNKSLKQNNFIEEAGTLNQAHLLIFAKW